MFLDRLRACLPGAACAASLATAALWPFASATAQTATPVAAAASAAPVELTPAERAKRDGDKVFHWILIHGDKPRKPVATVAPKEDKPPPAVARVKPAARAPNRADEAAVETSSANAAPAAPQASLASVPASAPTPEPATTRATSANLASAALTVPTAPAAAAPVEDDSSDTLTPLSQAEPKFPINVVRALRTGQVRVKFTVQPDGSVADPTVIGTSSVRLNPSALAAVAQWRFAPVRKAQQGVVELGFKDAE
jgi:TonB family protein